MIDITVVQPSYFAGETPDEEVAEFLINQLKIAKEGSLIVPPEYSNAGGLSDKERELAALPRAEVMLKAASETAREKRAYGAVNVLDDSCTRRKDTQGYRKRYGCNIGNRG